MSEEKKVKEEVPKKKVPKEELPITDIITARYFREDGVEKAERVYLSGSKKVKTVIELA